jgi:hypothetical protein
LEIAVIRVYPPPSTIWNRGIYVEIQSSISVSSFGRTNLDVLRECCDWGSLCHLSRALGDDTISTGDLIIVDGKWLFINQIRFRTTVAFSWLPQLDVHLDHAPEL